MDLTCLPVFAVKLPELLAYVIIEEETLVRLQQKLLDFLKYKLHSLQHMFIFLLAKDSVAWFQLQ